MIILLYGDNTFLSREKTFSIRAKFLHKNPTGAGLMFFDCTDAQPRMESIIEATSAGTLFTQKNLVIIKNILTKGQSATHAAFKTFLEERGAQLEKAQDIVIIFWEEGGPRKNSKAFQWLVSHASLKQHYQPLSGRALDAWIQKRGAFYAPNSSFTSAARTALVNAFGNDLFTLDMEIAKLTSYASAQTITDRDVRTIASPTLSAHIFETLDALSGSTPSRAAYKIHNHITRGEDPFYIFTMILYHFRTLLVINDYRQRGVTREYEIAKAAKLHPFVVKKSMRTLQSFSPKQLRIYYDRLAAHDRAVKIGAYDMLTALDLFVAELSTRSTTAPRFSQRH